MRSVLTCLLVLCFGLSMPAVGGPVCLCIASLFTAEEDCCGCCGSGGCCDGTSEEGEGGSCCVKLDELPDASAPEPMASAPETPVRDLVGEVASPSRLLFRFIEEPEADDDRIRGPTSGSARRAVLAIWRL